MVVPSVFDSFAAFIIAPDHLLASYFRDILNSAFISFARASERRNFERILFFLVSEAGFEPQNRIYSFDENKILAIGLSNLYSLVLFAERAYLVAHEKLLLKK